MKCSIPLPRITELNPHLICVLCGGYYIDATTIVECLHAFCKSCIVRYLETSKYCPICDVLVHKSQPLQNIRADKIRQSIVYKLVPDLYKREMRNRRNFYVRVQPQLRPPNGELCGQITAETSAFFSHDDTINLSLEYLHSATAITDAIDHRNYVLTMRRGRRAGYGDHNQNVRYFKCEAAVTVENLRKLLAAKYDLRTKHEIRFFLQGIRLPEYFKLLDVAYIASWKRVGYIRLFFEILIEQKQRRKPEIEQRSHTTIPIRAVKEKGDGSEVYLPSSPSTTPTPPQPPSFPPANETTKNATTHRADCAAISCRNLSAVNARREHKNDDHLVDDGKEEEQKKKKKDNELPLPIMSRRDDSMTTRVTTVVINAASATRIASDDTSQPAQQSIAVRRLRHHHEAAKLTTDIERRVPGRMMMSGAQEMKIGTTCAINETIAFDRTAQVADHVFNNSSRSNNSNAATYSNSGGDANHKRKVKEEKDTSACRLSSAISHQRGTAMAGDYSDAIFAQNATTIPLSTIRTTTKTPKLSTTTAAAVKNCCKRASAAVPAAATHVEIWEASKCPKMFKTCGDTPRTSSSNIKTKIIDGSTARTTSIAAVAASKPLKIDITGNSIKSTSVIKVDPKTLSPMIVMSSSSPSSNADNTKKTEMATRKSTPKEYYAHVTPKSFAPFLDMCTKATLANGSGSTANATGNQAYAANATGNQAYTNVQSSSLLPMNQFMRRLFSNLESEPKPRKTNGFGENEDASTSKMAGTTATVCDDLYRADLYRCNIAAAMLYDRRRRRNRLQEYQPQTLHLLQKQQQHACKYNSRGSESSSSSADDIRIKRQKSENESTNQSKSKASPSNEEQKLIWRMESTSSEKSAARPRVQQRFDDDDDEAFLLQKRGDDIISKSNDTEQLEAAATTTKRVIVREKAKEMGTATSAAGDGFFINNLIASDEKGERSECTTKSHRCSRSNSSDDADGALKCDQINTNTTRPVTAATTAVTSDTREQKYDVDDSQFRINNR